MPIDNQVDRLLEGCHRGLHAGGYSSGGFCPVFIPGDLSFMDHGADDKDHAHHLFL